MKDQHELFGQYSSGMKYPHAPGFKREGTSSDAAREVEREASTLRRNCLEVIDLHPSTADEVAEQLQRSVLAIRPRLSELVARGRIVESGERRPNASGKMAVVWKTLK